MKLQIASDLHLTTTKTNPINPSGDILVIAGDLARLENGLHYDFFNQVCNQFEHVVYVAGNHEFDLMDYHAAIELMKELGNNFSNLHYLENDTVVINDIKFVGGVLWSNFNDYDWFVLSHAKKNISDFEVIKYAGNRFSPEVAYELNAHTRKHIVKETMGDEKCVVVTHFLPDFICVSDRFRGKELTLNYYFANTNLVEKVLDNNVPLWIHGHTHDSIDVNAGDMRIVCNPFLGNKSYNSSLVIEI